MNSESIVTNDPQIKAFLSKLVREVSGEEVSAQDQEAAVRALGLLLQERFAKYLNEKLSPESAQELNAFSSTEKSPQEIFSHTQRLIPSVQSDLKVICEKFYQDYSH